MNTDKHLIQVTRKSFEDYLKGKTLTKRQGIFMHEDYWLLDEEIVASLLTSSYGAPPIYKIKEGDAPRSNIETIAVVTSIFNNKLG